MYKVLDIPVMMKTTKHIRTRKAPLRGYNSVILLRGGEDISVIPPDSEIRRVSEVWEVHMKISNPEIVKRLAQHLNAIGYIV